MRRTILIVTIGLVMTLTSVADAVSPAGAFFRSLIVPGWGQYALGKTDRALLFGGTEAALWLGVGWMSHLESTYTDDYRGYATAVAGANVAGKSRDYFDDLAFYDSRTLHNQVARVDDQPDPFLYSVEDDWQWPTAEDRLRFRSRYNDAKKMNRNIDYTVLVITLNHLASAIDAAKTGSRLRSAASESSRVGFLPTYDGGMRMVLSYRL